MAVTWDWKSEIWWFPFPSLRLPLDILLFWNVFSGVLPFRLMIFFLFLFGILSSGWPHCGWQVGVEETQCRCSKTKQMNWVCEAKVLRSRCPRSEAHIINCPPRETTTRKSSLSRLKEYRPSGPVNLPEFETVEVQKNTHKFGFSMFCVLFTYLLLFFACAFACVRWGFSIRSWLSWTRWA